MRADVRWTDLGVVTFHDYTGIKPPVSPDKPGIYLFKCVQANNPVHRYYIGQTQSFKNRMGHYLSRSRSGDATDHQEARIVAFVKKAMDEGYVVNLVTAEDDFVDDRPWESSRLADRKALEAFLVAKLSWKHQVENDDAL